MPDKIYVNNSTKFFVTIVENGTGVNLSTSVSHTITFKKPDSSILSVSGTLQSTGVSGVMFYTAQSGDLDLAGQWKIQGFVDLGATQFYSEPSSFRVYKNL
jgi:hypothetical protein